MLRRRVSVSPHGVAQGSNAIRRTHEKIGAEVAPTVSRNQATARVSSLNHRTFCGGVQRRILDSRRAQVQCCNCALEPEVTRWTCISV